MDIKLQLLAGLPIIIDDINIVPLTLKDIAMVGEGKYNEYLSVICFELTDVFGEDLGDLTIFDVIIINCINDVEFKNMVLKSLYLFTNNLFEFREDYGVFICENKIIHKDNFGKIINIIKKQNCIKEKKEEEYNPANEAARKLIENIKNKEKEYAKVKKNNGLTLYDLISVYSAYGNISSINDAFNLTMYQFNDQFQRMNIMKEYDINVQALLHGADSKKVKLDHYIKKI